MNENNYQICTKCIMDTSDPDIVFDDEGVCNHCHEYQIQIAKYTIPEHEKQVALAKIVTEIKQAGQGGPYDCIIGVSGGVDSTYVAYLVKQLGLRPLAVHVDNGWNSELAVSNIEKVLTKLEIDLHTEVLDWDEFKDLQMSFLKASVPDGEIPTDHAIWAVIAKTAAKHSIRYIVNGFNFSTEASLPRKWAYGHDDWRYIKGVQKQFGTRPLKSYPHRTLVDLFYRFSFIHPLKGVNILDYVPYCKEDVIKVLQAELGWRPYGGKHYESIYTRFYQGYILVEKFGIDKRRLHLSTLACSGQLSREEALTEVKKTPYDGYMLEEDMEYVLKKLNITRDEFDKILQAKPRTYEEFSNSIAIYKWKQKLRLRIRLKSLITKLNSPF